jgi:hypothetical protein
MNIQKLSIKRYVLGGFTAAALLLPLTIFAGSARAESLGSHGVRGELPVREAQLLGQNPHSSGLSMTQPVQANPQHLSLAERAISASNPNKPRNSN